MENEYLQLKEKILKTQSENHEILEEVKEAEGKFPNANILVVEDQKRLPQALRLMEVISCQAIEREPCKFKKNNS